MSLVGQFYFVWSYILQTQNWLKIWHQVLLLKQVIDTGMSSMVKHTPMLISALLAASADQEEQELGLKLQSEWEHVLEASVDWLFMGDNI